MKGVAKFIWEDIIYYYSLFRYLVVDRGTENIGEVISLLSRIGVNRIRISLYNSRANRTIKRGHRSILEALYKMTDRGLKGWVARLYSVLLAERITIHRPTGVDPFSIVYRQEYILLTESRYLI